MPRVIVPCSWALPALLALSCGYRTPLFPGQGQDARHGGEAPAHNPTEIVPDDAGVCLAPTRVCGSGSQARCQDLDNDPANCGDCGRSCTPGVACVAGECQQRKCTGTVAFHEIGRYPSSLRVTDTRPYYDYLGADVNRDGRLDLIEYDELDNLAIWVGQRDGSFSKSASYATVGTASTPALRSYAAVGDFDEDGRMDLLVSTKSGSTVALRPGLPGGGFGGPAGPPLGRLNIGDIDRDGHLDAIQVRQDAEGYIQRFTVLRGRGDGSFAEGESCVPTNAKVVDYALQDWDGDGTLDLIGNGSAVHVWLGHGDGTFAQEQRCALAFSYGVLADFNQDGKLDAAWAVGGGPRLATIVGSGTCNFSPRKDYELSASQSGYGVWPWALGLGDLSGDGFIDLVVRTQVAAGSGWIEGTVFLLGKGDGTFAVERYAGGAMGSNTYVADVNEDGYADIVAADTDIAVFSNTCER